MQPLLLIAVEKADDVPFRCVDTVICFRASRADESARRSREFPVWQAEITSLNDAARGVFNINAAAGEI